MKRFHPFVILILTVISAPGVAAVDVVHRRTLSLAPVFTDYAVLQREIPVLIWGHGVADTKVTVSFADQTKTAAVDHDGKWSVKLEPMKANTVEQALVITDQAGAKVAIKHVLVGDVWICSGQSNMAGKVRDNRARQDPNDDLMKSNFPAIRHNDGKNGWKPATPEFVREFTRVGFCFARKVHREQKIPIGLLNRSTGGSRIESWIAKRPDTLPEETGRKNVTYGGLYSKHVAPVVGYSIRGALWYQGEANANEGHTYLLKMQALIHGWRTVWKQDDFPFYFVQLAGIGNSPDDKPAMGDGRAKVREAQQQVLKTVKNTGMAVAIDIGAAGEHDIVPSGPLYQSAKVDGSAIRITFKHADGLMFAEKTDYIPPKPTPDKNLPWLSIQDREGKWHWADAKIDGKELVVSSNAVTEPVAVRYAYTNRPVGAYLYNGAGLPASPFTTEKDPLGE